MQSEYQTPCTRSAKYSNSTFLAWAVLCEYLQHLYLLAFVCIIITLSVVKLAIATGHAMQVFNHCIIQIDAGLLVWHDQLPW